MDIREIFASSLRKRRHAMGLSHEELAHRAEVDRTYIKAWPFLLSHSVWFKDQVAIDDYPNRKTGPDCQGRLHVEVTSNDLLAGLVKRIPCPPAKRLEDETVTVPGVGAKLGPNAKQRGQQPRLEQLAPMMIDLVLKPSISPGVSTRLPLKDDRSAIRHNQARPDQEDARLAEGNLAVVDSDQPRSLGTKRSASTSKVWHFLPTTS
jgi:hypothetical protein